MILSSKSLSRAFVPLALLACALPASVVPAQQQRREQPPARPASGPPAQLPTPSPQSSSEAPSQPSRQVSEDEADVAITANVTASSLRFEAVPDVTVEFPGRPRRETAWEAERTNLPRPVQPGVTYRDVGVRLKIVSVFADIDRIVAEALGEVPPSDDGAQPNAPPPANNTTTTDERADATNGAAATNDAAVRSETAATNDAGPRAPTSRRARARPPRRQR
ncbi:MAG TPA: hypothetical protein VIP46_20195 [Pyrinomonadaceae bacterium]